MLQSMNKKLREIFRGLEAHSLEKLYVSQRSRNDG